MALNVKTRWQVIWRAVCVLLVLGFFGMLGLLVYNEKYLAENRSERQPTVAGRPSGETGEQEKIDETPRTKEEIAAYTVAPSKPRYLSIARLGIVNARVVEVGLVSGGEVGAPSNVFDVGWYTNSGIPGAGGAMLIDGHNGGPTVDGVFKHLDQIVLGDELIVERGDGKILKYEVKDKKILSLKDANNLMASMLGSIEAGKEGLNLISCTGEWNQSKQTYNSRVMIYAILKP